MSVPLKTDVIPNLSGWVLKKGDGQYCTAGSIIYRQRGTKIYPGTNTMRGGDDTIFATKSGIVKYERWGKNRTRVSVYEVEE